MSDPTVDGAEAYRRSLVCKAWAGYDFKSMSGELAARLWLAPAREDALQIARPIDPERKAWIEAWDAERGRDDSMVPSPYGLLQERLRGDPNYAWAFHYQIACAALDEGVTDSELRNRIASRAMMMLFGIETKEPE